MIEIIEEISYRGAVRFWSRTGLFGTAVRNGADQN